ncbi:GNAT family N-acetyltransferase [Candidatus Woesearchaeota archaeon]|nr:GNAT family N-acetyltransferase [Candidatus Woesearchaeota archaeon]
MKIREVLIGSRKDNALWKMIRKEWPGKGNGEFEARLRRCAGDKRFFTAAEVIIGHRKVIGGCRLSNHPSCLTGFLRKFPSLKNKNLIRGEDFVILPEMRGKGLGEKFLGRIKKRYLRTFDGIIFHSRMPYVREFYQRLGAEVLFDGRKFGQRYCRAFKKNVLKKRSIFLFSKKPSKFK